MADYSSALGGGSFYRPPTIYKTPSPLYTPHKTAKKKYVPRKRKDSYRRTPTKPKSYSELARLAQQQAAATETTPQLRPETRPARWSPSYPYPIYLPTTYRTGRMVPATGGAPPGGAGGVYFNPYRGTTSLAQYYGRGWLDPMFGGSTIDRMLAGPDPRQYTGPLVPGPANVPSSDGYGGGGGGYGGYGGYSSYGSGGYSSGGGGTTEEEQRPPLWIPPRIIWRL